MSLPKRVAGWGLRTAIRVLPPGLVVAGLRQAALCPPGVKTHMFERACARAATLVVPDPSTLARTNLGVSSSLRCDIPFRKSTLVFGRPQRMVSERSTLALVAELSRDCQDFLDVGANEGVFTFTVHAATASRGVRLHWFEPDRDLHARLAQNLAANGIVATGHQAAVADRAGEVTFHRNLSDDLSGSITEHFTAEHDTEREAVRAVALGEYLVECDARDALIKVDVEGAGASAWAGVAPAADRLRYLVIEMLEPEISGGLPARIIAETGFHAYYMNDFQLEASTDGQFRYVEPFWNWLFCRLDPAALSARLAGTPFRVV
jgi:FkbM family methyltransferase